MPKRYQFSTIEETIQSFWEKNKVATPKPPKGPKKYILDMFPYPSGSGLHIGHLIGYYASDTLAIAYKMQGYNVLHPMGFDAFGLPAEQYAVETGQHPAITTAKNIAAYKKVLKRAGLSFDWERSFSTTDPSYYRWTQSIFLQFFDSWYNDANNKAEPITSLIKHIAQHGNKELEVKGEEPPVITADQWHDMNEVEQQKLLSYYRLAYLAPTTVNWCPALGTVLANEEVQNGFSERGGHPVIRKKMNQWSLRIIPYADRLLQGLEQLEWSPAVKEMQRNWIGRSEGAYINFTIPNQPLDAIKVFSTRPDTIFGATFLVLAPEHPMVPSILHILQQQTGQNGEYNPKKALQEITDYVKNATNRSSLERMQEVNKITGVNTHIHAIHPFTNKKIPIWIGDYVLPHYGTGAIMAVPAHDQRDYDFATHFQLPIIQVVQKDDQQELPYDGKEGSIVQSDFLNGMSVQQAQQAVISSIAKQGIGTPRVMYKLRDPVFSRQRYWGEPFPIYYRDQVPYPLDQKQLPLELPKITTYKPNEKGEPPLSRAKNWITKEGNQLEYNTMPGWAGSSWYFLRYMDPHNQEAFASQEALNYWKDVDCYIGGAEHTTGHLLYARFFTKVLYDLELLSFQEPFKRLINQGMVQGNSAFVYRIQGTNQFVSYGLRNQYNTTPMHVDVNLVTKGKLDLKEFKKWRPYLKDATFVLENDEYICGHEVEKMSKSKYNTVDPQMMLDRYGSDALRLHLLFLGPLTQAKPWSTKGLEGTNRFMQKYWNLFHNEKGEWNIQEGKSTTAVQQILHQGIKQVRDSLERYAFNTCVSGLMIMVKQLAAHTPIREDIVSDLVRILAPFAPHMAEYLWQQLGHQESVIFAKLPNYNSTYLASDTVEYPIAINGKKRSSINIPIETSQDDIISKALSHPTIVKWLQNQKPKKVIVVPKRMVNIVL